MIFQVNHQLLLMSGNKVNNMNEKEDSSPISPSQTQLSSLLEHYQNGRFTDAEKLSLEIIQDFPKHQFAWKVLGAVLGTTGRKSEAEAAYQRAVALSPQDAEAHNNLGNTHNAVGSYEEAQPT